MTIDGMDQPLVVGEVLDGSGWQFHIILVKMYLSKYYTMNTLGPRLHEVPYFKYDTAFYYLYHTERLVTLIPGKLISSRSDQ